MCTITIDNRSTYTVAGRWLGAASPRRSASAKVKMCNVPSEREIITCVAVPHGDLSRHEIGDGYNGIPIAERQLRRHGPQKDPLREKRKRRDSRIM